MYGHVLESQSSLLQGELYSCCFILGMITYMITQKENKKINNLLCVYPNLGVTLDSIDTTYI